MVLLVHSSSPGGAWTAALSNWYNRRCAQELKKAEKDWLNQRVAFHQDGVGVKRGVVVQVTALVRDDQVFRLRVRDDYGNVFGELKTDRVGRRIGTWSMIP